ncbi:MAG: HAD family phosphatase [Lachnospiraceae bacterium]|nr:HAD family phosphatase [Lachnospiraceae bacterium]MBR3808196.1 HAD family phosphatase [Lachnospiraceae bacterium]
MLNNIKACLFDMDGTLLDSMHIWKDIDIEFLGRFGYELPPTLQREIEGMSFRETACYIKDRFSLPPSIEEIMNIWNEMAFQKYSEEIFFKEGAFEFVKMLKEKGIRTAICTSNSRELVNAVAEHLGFMPYFDTIITSCEVGAGKPAPDIYLEAAKRVGVEPEHCLVFEDIVTGLTAGKRAGMKLCAVEDVYSADQREAKKAMSDYYVENYLDLL